MQRYIVHGEITVSAYIAVMASSPEEAMEKARGVEGQWQPGRFADPDLAVVDDLDGELMPTRAELAAEDKDK